MIGTGQQIGAAVGARATGILQSPMEAIEDAKRKAEQTGGDLPGPQRMSEMEAPSKAVAEVDRLGAAESPIDAMRQEKRREFAEAMAQGMVGSAAAEDETDRATQILQADNAQRAYTEGKLATNPTGLGG